MRFRLVRLREPMTTELARKINSAANAVWFFREGISATLSKEHVLVVKECSAAQIETAIEHIHAENRDSKSTIYCTLGDNVAPGIKAYADALALE